MERTSTPFRFEAPTGGGTPPTPSAAQLLDRLRATTAPEPAPISGNVEEAATFLRNLYGNAETGYLTLNSLTPTGGMHTDWEPVTAIEAIVDRAMTLALAGCVWFGVGTRLEPLPDAKRGGGADCLELPGLWLDVDVAGPHHAAPNLPPNTDKALEFIYSFGVAPTLVVNSGHGLQPWWLFPEMVPVAEVTELLAHWKATWEEKATEAGWHLDSVSDLARIMRLPGTINHKGVPVPVTVLDEAATARWSRHG